MFQNYCNKYRTLTFPISLTVMKLLVISIMWADQKNNSSQTGTRRLTDKELNFLKHPKDN